MAWNRLSTLGWASSPANAGTTRMSTARPRSMNPARFSATLPVPGSGQQPRRLGHHRADVRQQGLRQQVLLVLEVVVQRAVGHLGFPGDVPDGQPGAAALVDQPGGGGDQVFAEVLPVAVAEHGWFPR